MLSWTIPCIDASGSEIRRFTDFNTTDIQTNIFVSQYDMIISHTEKVLQSP
jgi:hypothetical protein